MSKDRPTQVIKNVEFPIQIKSTIYLLFFLSGACGLIYETIWIKMLGLILGNSIYAVALVVATYMAGLGIGSYWAGTAIENKKDHLRFYAILEILIGIFALGSPFVMEILKFLYTLLGHHFSNSALILNIYRLSLAFLVLVIPTIIMGATLPVLSKFMIRRSSEIGAGIGHLYGFNTLGAFFGTVAAGFVLIGLLGVHLSLYLTALTNLLIGSIAFYLQKKLPDGNNSLQTSVQRTEGKDSRNQYSNLVLKFILVTFVVTGFTSIAYEVIWTRALAYFIGHTTYAFATILSTFLLGIGLGSIILSKFSDRIKNPLITLALIEIAIGFSGMLGIPIIDRAFYALENITSLRTWGTPIWLKFLNSSIIMAIPTILMGMAFPLASKIYLNAGSIGKGIGKIYFVNTAGGILGSFAAVFVLMPAMGIQNSTILIASVNLILGIFLLMKSQFKAGPGKIALSIGLVLIFTLTSFSIHSENIFSATRRVDWGKSLYYREGLNNTIEILERKDGTRDLFIDGELNASTSRMGTLVHMLLAQLPMLLHDNPRDVFIVGLGSGMTSGAALRLHDSKITCAEISSDIVDAAREFKQWNAPLFESDYLNLIIDDGRITLLTDPKKYDVMITGIIHPKYNPGNAGLYSRDYYELCKSRLDKNGIMCQWLPLNALRKSEFKMIIRTFMSVFPHASLWFEELYGGDGNYNAILIGTDKAQTIDYGGINQRAFRSGKSLLTYDDYIIHNVEELLSRFIISEEKLLKYVGNGQVITDNKPHLEFGTVEINDFGEILNDLQELKENVWPRLANLPATDMEKQAIQSRLFKLNEISKACIKGDLYRKDNKVLEFLRQYVAAAMIDPENETLKEEIRRLCPKTWPDQSCDQAFVAQADELKSRGKIDVAIELYTLAMILAPEKNEIKLELGQLLQASKRFDQAIAFYEEILQYNPNNYEIRNGLGIAYMQKNLFAEAEHEFNLVSRTNPDYVPLLVNQALMYLKMNRTDKAITMLNRAKYLAPTDTRVLSLLNEIQKKNY